MYSTQFARKLEKSTLVKWLLFNRLRQEFEDLDYSVYRAYQDGLQRVPERLIRYWEHELKPKYANDPDVDVKRLRGFLFEALFYFAYLRTEALFKDAEILEMSGATVRRDEYPPWLEANPLYDVVAPLHHLHSKNAKELKSPQTRCDFLVTYADDKGALPPALVDVKSRRPKEPFWNRDKLSWQLTSAARRGFIFQLAYPKSGIKYPTCLNEWEFGTPCLRCDRLSENSRTCSQCGAVIFAFSIADSIRREPL
jgi:hypothetical protein